MDSYEYGYEGIEQLDTEYDEAWDVFEAACDKVSRTLECLGVLTQQIRFEEGRYCGFGFRNGVRTEFVVVLHEGATEIKVLK